MRKILLILISSLLFAGHAHAAPDPETTYIFNSFSFLFNGVLVMLMAAGFSMLEAGMVRSKNAALQSTKNIAIFAISGLLYWLVGYNLMYMDVSGWIGSLQIWQNSETGQSMEAILASGAGYTSASDWFFQMVFVATTASIVSGAVAERIKLNAFLLFVVVLVAVIYPIQGSWSWGGGFLYDLGFLDFAGSTIVHSVGGWAALCGVCILGARKGKFVSGQIRPIPGSNLPLATIGVFVLWFGWFGFNGGSQLAMGTGADILAISTIFLNTNLAAAAGVATVLVVTIFLYKRVDLTLVLNGALGGLVAITAEPLMPTPALAVFIGAIGGLVVVLTVPMLDRLRIDDVVGAVPVHLFAGIWGTLAVVLSNPDATIIAQVKGIVFVGLFVCATSSIVWLTLKYTMGIRVDEEDEYNGLDLSECGVDAYPEFSSRG